MKKSLLATVFAEPSVKAESVSKLAVLEPDAYLTIFVVAPASVLVNVDVPTPVACAVVRVIVPAVTDANTALGVPRVGVCPLIDAADKVATLEAALVTVTV